MVKIHSIILGAIAFFIAVTSLAEILYTLELLNLSVFGLRSKYGILKAINRLLRAFSLSSRGFNRLCLLVRQAITVVLSTDSIPRFGLFHISNFKPRYFFVISFFFNEAIF